MRQPMIQHRRSRIVSVRRRSLGSAADPAVSEPLERRVLLAAGELDATFDGNGMAAAGFPAPWNGAEAVLAVAGGKALVGTAAGVGYRIARLNADGTLDRTFGGDGRVSGYGRTGMTVARDGKVLVAGPGLGVTRYNADGTLDAAFGRGGADGDGVVTATADPLSTATSVATLPDGKVLVAGRWNAGEISPGEFIYDVALVRYLPDGSLDSTFGANGVSLASSVYLNYFGNGSILKVLPSSKLLAYAWLDNQRHGLMRFKPDFTLDTTFGGGDGIMSEAWDTAFTATAIEVGQDRILVAGRDWAPAGDSNTFTVRRFTTGGSWNAVFGNGSGRLTIPADQGGGADPRVSLAPDGRVVVAGSGATASRYTAAGATDGTFGRGGADGDGRVTLDFRGGDDAVSAVAVGPSGEVLVAGRTSNSLGGTDLTVARLTAVGVPDVAFSGDGELETRFPATAAAAAVAVQADGKTVVAGGVDHAFAMARYNTDGSLDASFGAGGIDGNGRILQPIEPGAFGVDGLSGLAVLHSGKMLAVGTAGRQMLAVRYNADGSLDQTFGTYASGTVSIESEAVAHALVRLRDGKFLVAGTYYTSRGHSPRVLLARLNPDGTRDTTFGDGGDTITHDFPDNHYVEHATAAAVGDDGRFVVVGPANGGAGFAVIRYSADGVLDTSFGTGGLAVIDFDAASNLESPQAVTVLRGGSVAVAGRVGGDAVVARLTPSGSLDLGFNGRGYATSLGAAFNAILPTAGEKLILGGHSARGDFLLARYSADGTPDRSFDPAGRQALANFGGLDAAAALALVPDGRILAVGSTAPADGGSSFAVARFRGDPVPPDYDLPIDGTSAPDTIRVIRADQTLRVEVNGAVTTRPLAGIRRLVLSGFGGDDQLYVDRNVAINASLYGGDGDDVLHGGGGRDEFFGGAGSDAADFSDRSTRQYLSNDDLPNDGANRNENIHSDVETLIGGSGDDVLDGNGDNNRLSGMGGNDRLAGGGGGDHLDGGDGDDVLDGGAGGDVMLGGAGNDTVDYSARTARVTVGIGSLPDDGETGEGDNVRTGVERVVGGSGDDTLKGGGGSEVIEGGGGNDRLYGLAGGDTLIGGAGNDRLDGGAGDDSLDGGDGIDTVNYSSRAAPISFGFVGVVQSKVLTETGSGGAAGETDTATAVENVTGGSGDDALAGSSIANVLNGGAGNDVLRGGDGDDRLVGGAGDDRLDGEDGDDVFDSGTGSNTIVDPRGSAGLSAGVLRVVGTTAADVIAVTISGTTLTLTRSGFPTSTYAARSVTSVWLDGIGGDDTLRMGEADGSSAPALPARLSGGSGNDRLTGGLADDTLSGGDGDDRLWGAAGSDSLFGGAGGDHLYGGSGDDTLAGGDGDDVLVSVGGGQNDRLRGDAGSDSFWGDAEVTEEYEDLEEAEAAGGSSHRVAAFRDLRTDAGGVITTMPVSRELDGQLLLDPLTDSGTYASFSDRPLFGPAGPHKEDIFQGVVGDCYFLAGLSAVAKQSPHRIRQSIVDLGDGTYAVQFYKSGEQRFYRIDADLPAYGTTPAYARLGSGGSTWVALLEKVFAFMRYETGSYPSLHAGGIHEAFDALTAKYTYFWGDSALELLGAVSDALAQGRAVTALTPSTPPPTGTPAVPWHAYSVERVDLTYGPPPDGPAPIAGTITLRNPWGYDGAGNDSNPSDGYVSFTADQFFGYFIAAASGEV